jgi:hypothetical protein
VRGKPLQVLLPMKPAPPVTRTVSINQLCLQRPPNEMITGKGGFASAPSASSAHASLGAPELAPRGLIARTVLTMLTMPIQQPCCFDNADEIILPRSRDTRHSVRPPNPFRQPWSGWVLMRSF